MKELHVEGLATHDDPEPCTGVREGAGEAWDGPGIEPRNCYSRAPMPSDPLAGIGAGPWASRDPGINWYP